MTADLLLAIDEGTSSARAIVYDRSWTPIATAARQLQTLHPQPGWAEQDPEEIRAAVVQTVAEVLDAVGGPSRIAATGIANQGETVVAWDSRSGEPLAPAVLWSCRRSQTVVDRVAAEGHGSEIHQRTGLPLDAYFSASKIRWLLEETPEVRDAARDGNLRAGTIDAWLTARLGDTPLTDPSTASRTQLFSLGSLAWDPELAAWWGVPLTGLPRIVPTTGDLGVIRDPAWDAELPLRALVCDQQAALAGQGGHRRAAIKATFGTGVFVLANAGSAVPQPPPGILATVAWGDPAIGATYALDGGVFSAGSLLDWLRDDLGVLRDAAAIDEVALGSEDAAGVRILPALTGLGAPWWRPDARVVINGLSAATRPSHLARAAIDAIAQRAVDVVEAMDGGGGGAGPPIRIDGGLTGSRLLVQRFADLAGRRVEVAADAESTALGTAVLAGIGAGWITPDDAADLPRTAHCVEPGLDPEARRAERDAWARFVATALDLAPSPSGKPRFRQEER